MACARFASVSCLGKTASRHSSPLAANRTERSVKAFLNARSKGTNRLSGFSKAMLLTMLKKLIRTMPWTPRTYVRCSSPMLSPHDAPSMLHTAQNASKKNHFADFGFWWFLRRDLFAVVVCDGIRVPNAPPCSGTSKAFTGWYNFVLDGVVLDGAVSEIKKG